MSNRTKEIEEITIIAQNRYSTRSSTPPFFCPTFFTAAILLGSGFGFTIFLFVEI